MAKLTVGDVFKKWTVRLTEEGKIGLTCKKFTAAEVEQIKALKPEIIAELHRREAEKAARKAAEEAAQQEELHALQTGEKAITVRYHDGEYLSGWEVFSQAANLLEGLGLAKYVNGWGYHVPSEVVRALGESFTYPAAVEHTRPAAEAAVAKKAQAADDRRAKFDTARQTGKPVLLRRWTADCSDPEEECNLDIVCEWAMPDGSLKTERQHTW